MYTDTRLELKKKDLKSGTCNANSLDFLVYEDVFPEASKHNVHHPFQDTGVDDNESIFFIQVGERCKLGNQASMADNEHYLSPKGVYCQTELYC